MRVERSKEKYQRTEYKKEFVRELWDAASLPPEASFNNVNDLLSFLNRESNPDGPDAIKHEVLATRSEGDRLVDGDKDT